MVNMRMGVRPVVTRGGVLLGIALALTALTFVLGCPHTGPTGSSGYGAVVVYPRPSELDAGWVLFLGWGDSAFVHYTGFGDERVECMAGDYSLEWHPVDGYGDGRNRAQYLH